MRGNDNLFDEAIILQGYGPYDLRLYTLRRPGDVSVIVRGKEIKNRVFGITIGPSVHDRTLIALVKDGNDAFDILTEMHMAWERASIGNSGHLHRFAA